MPMVVDLCPYWCMPPAGGGPSRVHNLNQAVSKDWDVLQLSFRPTIADWNRGIRYWSKKKHIKISSTYQEIQFFDPIIGGVSFILYSLGLPHDLLMDIILRVVHPPRLLARRIRQYGKPSILQFEHPWLYRYALSLRKILRCPIIYVAHNVESDLLDQDERYQSKLGSYFTSKVKEKEIGAIRECDAVVVVSNLDREKLNSISGMAWDHFHTVPSGVDTSSIKPAGDIEKKAARNSLGLDEDKVVLLFIGSDHYPNRDALAFITKIIKEQKVPDRVILLVVGTVSSYVSSSNRVQAFGYVEDIHTYLAAADIAMNPLFAGSGTSLKVLTYMAAGLPVVSTDKGIRGLDLEHDKHVLLAEQSEFASAITQLVHDSLKRKQLGNTNRAYVEQYLGWDKLGQDMIAIYRELERRYMA